MNEIDFTKLKPGEYARKSSESEDKQMLSIVSQHEANLKSAEYYKLPAFVDVFQEAKSAKTEFMRPEFSRMMSAIERGLIDCIVCWKPDRLARNMTEGGKIIDLLSSGKLKAIISHDKVYYPWDNVMVLSIEFSQGKQFVKELSINVKRGQTKKASMGIPHGIASLGFLNDKTEEKGNRKWLVDELKLNQIKTLLDMFLTGTYSAGSLHRYAVETLKLTTVKHKRIGGCLIQRSRIYEILKDPIYAGFFFYGGQRYELDTNLPQLITEDQHNRIKTILSKKHIPKIKEHKTTFSGFLASDEGDFIGQDVKFQLICDCKRKFAYMSKTHCPFCNAEIDKLEHPKYLEYTLYYNIRKKKARQEYRSLSEDKIVNKLAQFVDANLTFSQELAMWSREYLQELKNKELNEVIFKREIAENNRIEFEEKKARLRVKLRDGLFTDEEYRSDLEVLQKQYSQGEKVEEIDWYTRMDEIIDLTLRMKQVLQSGTVQQKRNILSQLGSNLIWNDIELSIHNDIAVETLVEGIKRAKLINFKFEPENCVVYSGPKEKTEVFSSVFSTMLRWQDSNLRPIDYTYPTISSGGGLYHHPFLLE